MQAIAVWLAALIPSFVGRVLAALGMGVVSYVGLDLAWTQLHTLIVSNFQGLPSAAIGLMSLAGVGDALGIMFGAITARVAFTVLASSARIAGIAK